MTPADTTLIGGLERFLTPILLFYRILRGSLLANMGACANVVTSHMVPTPECRTVGAVETGEVFKPYWLKVVARFKLAEIQVVDALFPSKNEYGYQVPFGD